MKPGRYAAALVFVVAFLLFWIRLGHWFYLSIDEGIYLEGARRVARGEVPYRDFFVITGPGTFWLYGAVFRVFGVSLAAARAVLCFELALLCALICRLTGRVANAAFAAASGSLFLAMLLTTQYPLYVTHRWDSDTLALLAVAFASADAFTAAGICIGLAIAITPPTFLIALAIAQRGRALLSCAAGIAAPLAAVIAALLCSGAWGSTIRSLVWDASNYSAANRLSYGALTGNFAGGILPVLLPPLAAAACILVIVRRAIVRGKDRLFFCLLGAAALAALAACYPRFGAAQLLFGSAFYLAVLTAAAGALIPKHAQTWVAAGMFLIAGGTAVAGWPHNGLRPIETPVGKLEVSKLHFVQMNDLLAAIKPGENLFVYPYLPALYFALGADNPTRYSWLQPGMMGPHDVETALAELRAHPPRWIIWHDFTEAFILKNWPSSDRTRLRFPEMENFFNANYHVTNPDGVIPIGYRLLERNP